MEALIVSQLRRERSCSDPDDLPELTDEEREAMNSLGTNLVERLWNSGRSGRSEPEAGDCDEQLACAGEAFTGMNRAEEIDDETKKALDEKRREVLERLRKKRERKDGTGV